MAQYYLGICYERGWGVERDLAKAAEMYSLASQRGHAGAECSLASLYARGLGGLPRDRKLALQLYESSVQGGNEEAEVEVRRLRQLLDEEAKEAELENEELASSGWLAILIFVYRFIS
ncbi:hypothetical protein NP493_4003g00009 [Ridgeia piscesae]|uniref:Uncharacterized protein n=1 Tax=Ridgeia piscesae TaxID=27915 RepID=A0AAD9J315_RIDPI|nr:hypothetical protein NP493_4003g00009 [Ridgeia piscesae]